MMRAMIEGGPPPLPQPSAPFLWRSPSGCIYLRNVENQDIIIGPRVPDQKLGRVVTLPHVTTLDAWASRLQPHEVLRLANA